MAATEELKVKVSADVAAGVNGVRQFNNELAKSSTQVKKSGKDYTNFSRVIQDLPFGFTGIQNNLTQLIPGVGALGLAFSGLIAGLTFLQVGTGAWTRGLTGNSEAVKTNADRMKEAKAVLDGYVESLNQISKIRLTGQIDAQEELGRLETLYTASQNINLSYKQRKEAVDLLQERYPAYFKNLSDEAILAGGAKAQYDALTKSILAASTARAAQKELDNLAEQGRILVKIRDEAQKNLTADEEAYKKRKAQNEKQIELAKKYGQTTLALQNGITNAARQYVAQFQLVEKHTKTVNDNLAAQKKISDEIQGLIAGNGVQILTGNDMFKLPDPVKKKEEIRQTLTGYRDFIARENPIGEIVFAFRLAELQAKKNPSENFGDKLLKEFLPKKVEPRINVAPELTLEQKEFQAKVLALTEQMNGLVTEAINSGIGNFAEGIGAGIVSGNFDDAFKKVATSVGTLIQDLGKLLIKAGVKAQAFKTAFFTTLLANPLAAIAVGAGLVIAGSALKAALPKPKGFATGGVIPPGFPNDSYYARLTSGERVLTPAQNKEWERRDFGRAGTMTFPDYLPMQRIEGSTLLMWLQRANTRGGRTS